MGKITYTILHALCAVIRQTWLEYIIIMSHSMHVLKETFQATAAHRGAQRAKIAEKVHKPPLGINVINFEFNGLNAFI